MVLDLPLFLSSFVLPLQSHRVHLFDKREIFWEEDYLIEISHRSDKRRRESRGLFFLSFVGVFLFRFFPRPLVSATGVEPMIFREFSTKRPYAAKNF